MGQFDIDYKPKLAIKAQALTNFLLEFSLHVNVTGQEEPDITMEEHVEENNCAPCWTIYVDGAVNSNGAGAGIELVSREGHHIHSSTHFDIKATNNDVEYEALIVELKLALEMKVGNLRVFSDSMLLIWHI